MTTTPTQDLSAARVFTPGYEANTPLGLDGKPIGGGPWIRIDGLAINDQAIWNQRIIPKVASEPGMHKSGYNDNNGLIQLNTVDGCKYTSVDTGNNRAALKKGCYGANNNVWVDMSNGEQLLDEDARNELDRIRRLMHANYETVQSPIKSNTIDVTNAYYETGFRFNKTAKQVISNPKDIGTYNISDTGIIALVNAKGEIRLGVNLSEKLLKDAGYRRSDTLEVPFAHDEKPVKKKPIYEQGIPTDKFTLIPDAELGNELQRLRNSPEYKIAMKQHVSNMHEENKQSALQVKTFFEEIGYRGSTPIKAYAEFIERQKNQDRDKTPGL